MVVNYHLCDLYRLRSISAGSCSSSLMVGCIGGGVLHWVFTDAFERVPLIMNLEPVLDSHFLTSI